MSRLQKLLYGLMALGALVSALTGIGTAAFGHPPMTHWVLMIHMTAAPVFALGLAGVAVTWADLCRAHSRPVLGKAAKILFWMLLLSGTVLVFSGVLPMLPLLGSEGQHFLYLTHRYAGFAFGLAVILHLPALKAPPAPVSSASAAPVRR